MFQINALNGEVINIDSDFLTHRFEGKSKFLVVPFLAGIGEERMFFLFDYDGEEMFKGRTECFVLLEDKCENKFTIIAHLDFYGYKNPVSCKDSPFQFFLSAPEIIEIREGNQFSTLGKGLCCTLKVPQNQKSSTVKEEKEKEKTRKFYRTSNPTYCGCFQCGGKRRHRNFF